MQHQDYDEQDGHQGTTLAEMFRTEQAEPPRHSPRRLPAVYRCYQGGFCRHCGEALGLIETDGGRTRLYCNGKCRVAHHRQQQRERERQQILAYHAELRDYWQQHSIRGEVLFRLQEILLQYGKDAARAATDAVLVAQDANRQAAASEKARLIEEVMLGGEAINFEEVRLADFRIPAGVNGWLEFVNHTTLPMLRRMRLYLHDRKQQETYKAAARQRLEQLSRDMTQHT